MLDFQGVFVSGSRALAQVVYRLSTRAPSGRFVARPPAIWTVTLAREDGRWRFVRGIELAIPEGCFGEFDVAASRLLAKR